SAGSQPSRRTVGRELQHALRPERAVYLERVAWIKHGLCPAIAVPQLEQVLHPAHRRAVDGQLPATVPVGEIEPIPGNPHILEQAHAEQVAIRIRDPEPNNPRFGAHSDILPVHGGDDNVRACVPLCSREGAMGRDIQAMTFGGEDRRKYREKVRRSLDVLAQMLRERVFEGEISMVGQEIELNLVDEHGAPHMRNATVLDAIADPLWSTEVGQFNLEINVPPRKLEGDALAGLETSIRASLNAADGKARSTGSRLVMVGILPTLQKEDVHEGAMSANARYKVLNEQVFAARGEDMRIEIDGPEPLLTHADSITPEAACTSVQLHTQVSPELFANYWNAAQAIAGVQVALAANSPFLFGSRLWAETRMTLFEQSTDTRPEELKQQGVRPRVWFGERWITSVFDLFEENIQYFPALLPICEDEDPQVAFDGGACPELAEMCLHNGTIYRWNRPVYAVVDGKPHVRV